MSTELRKAAQGFLEAIETSDAQRIRKAVEALRAALAAPVSMTDVKTWQQRCEEDPAHEGIVTHEMIKQKMLAEIEDLRAALAALTTKESADG